MNRIGVSGSGAAALGGGGAPGRCAGEPGRVAARCPPRPVCLTANSVSLKEQSYSGDPFPRRVSVACAFQGTSPCHLSVRMHVHRVLPSVPLL